MYSVIFKKDYPSPNQFLVRYDNFVHLAGPFSSLDGANLARKVSGDLVVDSKTLEVIPDPSWLWDWELNDPKTYAHQHVAFAMNKLT
jgi:hypothetical protein